MMRGCGLKAKCVGMSKNEEVGGGRSPQEEAETSSCFGVGIAKAVTSALY
jgi:hypothetical protein